MAIVPSEERLLYLRGFKWAITHTDGHVTSHKLLEYINPRTKRNVEFKVALLNVLSGLSILLSLAIGGFLIFRKFKPFFLNTTLWFIGSLIIYSVCMAGLVYNILHDIPFTVTDKNGNTEWISSQNRMQLGAEGFIMSIAISLSGVVMILWHKFVKFSHNSVFNRIGYLVLFCLTFLIIYFIEDTYKKKGWYNPNFYPPSNYIKGPLMRDQGNNI